MPASEKDTSPIKVGAIVLAVALAAWGLLWLTMTPDEPTGQTERRGAGAGLKLTDQQAVQRARELMALSEEAIEKRNPSLVAEAYTTDSPAAPRVQRDIRKLRRDGVIDQGEVQILHLEVIENTSTLVRIRETSLLRPCYLTEAGRDITKGPAEIQITGLWTFHWQTDNWLIYDTSLESDRAVDTKEAHCA